MSAQPWLTPAEAASVIGVSRSAVYHLCGIHAIRHRRVGVRRGKIQILRSVAEEYARSCEIAAGSPVGPTVPRKAASRPSAASPARHRREDYCPVLGF